MEFMNKNSLNINAASKSSSTLEQQKFQINFQELIQMNNKKTERTRSN